MAVFVQWQKKLEFVMGAPENFEEQVEKSDIIFINGGMKGCLKEELLKLSDVKSLFRGKVIVGISAGANMMSRYYFSSVSQSIREGLGILPIKLFTHYTENEKEDLALLERYGGPLRTYKIKEERFLVFDEKI